MSRFVARLALQSRCWDETLEIIAEMYFAIIQKEFDCY